MREARATFAKFKSKRIFHHCNHFMIFSKLLWKAWLLAVFAILTAHAAPKISCEKPVFDFGSRDASEVVNHTFELKNTGSTYLLITAVRPACGCTIAQLDKSVIQPGETSKLGAQLSLAGRGGEIQKPILIESNDPANPALQLSIKGKVATEFAIVPSILTLRQSAPDQPPSGTVQLTSVGRPFGINRIESSDPSIRVRADPMPGGRSQQISASLEKLPESDPQSFQLTIRTDNPRAPTIDIPAVVVLEKNILANPGKIFIPSGEVSLRKTVIIKVTSGNFNNIQNISTPSQSINVKTTKFKNHFRLEVSGLGKSEELAGNSIKIQFDNGDNISIPFLIKN